MKDNNAMWVIAPGIVIPKSEVSFQFARSSGPGGQNVNKVNTKATLRWSVAETSCLSEGVRARLVDRYGGYITSSGEMVIHSDRYRSQARNREDCLQKLREMLADVATPPKKRRATRPSRAAKQKRLTQKKRRGETKQGRRTPPRDD